jgi:MbtH protein
MTNPFEDNRGIYRVLINEEGQHSLWPAFIEIPHGWTVVHESDNRMACKKYIDEHWTDMRPRSLIKRMNHSKAKNGA